MEPGDYIVIIEDDDGVEIGRVRQSSDSKLPRIAEGVVLEPDDVQGQPHLVGSYRIRDINQQLPPEARQKRGGTRRNFKVPFVYVRPDRGANFAAAPAAPASRSLAPLDGELNKTVAAEIAHTDRQLATDLDDIADEVALLINEGAPIDRSVVERLNEARCIAKQNSIRALVHAKTSKPSG